MPAIDRNATVSALAHREALDEIDELRRLNNQLKRLLREKGGAVVSEPDHQERVSLSNCEKHVATVIAQHAPEPASKAEIAKDWPGRKSPSQHLIANILKRLRFKIAPLEIEIAHVRNKGWRLSESDARVVKRLCQESE